MSNYHLKVFRNGKHLGNFKQEEIRGHIAAGTLQSSDYYWQESNERWVRLSELVPVVVKHENNTLEEQTDLNRENQQSVEAQNGHTPNFVCDLCLCRFESAAIQRLYARVWIPTSIVALVLMGLDSRFWSLLGAVVLTASLFSAYLDGFSTPHCPYCKSTSIRNTKS
jgi:hypothetical protein